MIMALPSDLVGETVRIIIVEPYENATGIGAPGINDIRADRAGIDGSYEFDCAVRIWGWCIFWVPRPCETMCARKHAEGWYP